MAFSIEVTGAPAKVREKVAALAPDSKASDDEKALLAGVKKLADLVLERVTGNGVHLTLNFNEAGGAAGHGRLVVFIESKELAV